MLYEKLNEIIAPFYFMLFDDKPDDSWASLVMHQVGEYRQSVFDRRADEGFEGNGYDWNSLALVFVKEKMPDIEDKLNFDSESSMFCVRSSDVKTLEKFAFKFKALCDDVESMIDLFNKVELD